MSTTRYRLRHMTWIPGGTFRMGSDGFYPEERPVHQVTVDGYWMDEHPVTVADYRRFVTATSYQTCHLGFRCVVRDASPAGR